MPAAALQRPNPAGLRLVRIANPRGKSAAQMDLPGTAPARKRAKRLRNTPPRDADGKFVSTPPPPYDPETMPGGGTPDYERAEFSVHAPDPEMVREAERLAKLDKKAASKKLADLRKELTRLQKERDAAEAARKKAEDKAKREEQARERAAAKAKRAATQVSNLTFADVEHLIRESGLARGRKKNPKEEPVMAAGRNAKGQFVKGHKVGRKSGKKKSSSSGTKRRRSTRYQVTSGTMSLRRANPGAPAAARAVLAGFAGAAGSFGITYLTDKIVNPWGKVLAITGAAVGTGIVMAKANLGEGAAVLGALSGSQAVAIAGFELKAMMTKKDVKGIVRMTPDGQIAGVVGPAQLAQASYPQSAYPQTYDRDRDIRGLVSQQYPGI